MKKLLITLFALCFLAFGLAGCVSENGDKASTCSGNEVSDSTSEEESSGSSEILPPEDTAAPVITVDIPEGTPDEDGVYVFTTGIGEELILPAATAVDDVDGDLTDELYVYCDNDPTVDITDGKFLSKVLGRHEVTYYVYDEAQNEAYYVIYVNVTSDIYADTFDVEGYDDMDALNNDGGVYKENFARGAFSPLIYQAMPSVGVLEAGERGLDGNSIVIDYGDFAGGSSAAYIPNADRYLKKGKWTVSFDFKLVSGNAPTGFYFGFVKQGETVSTDKHFDLSSLTAGSVTTLTWQAVLDIPANADVPESEWYHLHFFEHSGNSNAVVALDNFVISFEELFIPETTIPTFEQFKEGFTFDWENNYMALDAAEPVMVEDIENSAAREAIQGAESGFSGVVLLLNGASHVLAAPKKSIDADTFQKGWVYTFEMDYYAVSVAGHYFIAFDGTSGNHAFASGFFKSGLNHTVIEYTVADKDYALTIYMTGATDEVYLGNMKITLKEPEYTREDYHTLTAAEVQEEGGYTFDFSENNAMKLNGQGKYMLVEKMEDVALKSAIEGTNAFTEGVALRYKAATQSGGVLSDLTPALVGGKEYTVTFRTYAVKNGNILLLPFKNGAQAPGLTYGFTRTDNADGTTDYTVTFLHDENIEEYNLYCTAECELYIATANFTAVEHVVSDTELKTLTETLTGSEINKFNKGTVGDGYVEFTSAAADVTFEMFRFSQLGIEGTVKSLKFTVNYEVVSLTGTGLYIRTDSDFTAIPAETGTHTATLEPASFDFFCLYYNPATSGTVRIASVAYEIVVEVPKAVPSDVTLTETLTGSEINKFNKGTVGDGYVEFTSAAADVTFEMFRFSQLGIEGTVKSLKFTVNYEVVSLTGTGLYIRTDSDFTAIPAETGTHTATLEPASFDFFCLYYNPATSGTVRIASVAYEIVVER